MSVFNIGAADAMEKVAKSTLHPRAIAGLMAEGKTISENLAKKFRISPGEINKAKKTARKMSRKAAVKKEMTNRSASKSFFSKLNNPPSTGPATKVTQHSAIKKTTGAAEALGL